MREGDRVRGNQCEGSMKGDTVEGYKADCTVKKTKVATAITDIISSQSVLRKMSTHTKQRSSHT